MTIAISPVQKRILLDHEKLTVYQVAIEFVVLEDVIIEHLPRGRAYLSDQLQREGLSIPLNIAEGAENIPSMKKLDFIGWLKGLLQNAREFWMCVNDCSL